MLETINKKQKDNNKLLVNKANNQKNLKNK